MATSVPLSNDTVHRRVEDMPDDVKQVTAELKGSSLGKFTVLFDELTGVSTCAQPLMLVRYVHRIFYSVLP